MTRLHGRTRGAWRRELTFLSLLASLCTIAFSAPAVAAILDEPESLTEGSDAVVRVHFDARVQYQRHAPTGTSDLVEVFFQAFGQAPQTATQGVGEEVRAPEHGRVPEVTVSYPAQPGAQAQVKKIICLLYTSPSPRD